MRVLIEVIPQSLQFELVLYFKKGNSKYNVKKLKFKTDSEAEREKWVAAINKFTNNLKTSQVDIDL